MVNGVSFDLFAGAFLSKIYEFELDSLSTETKTELVDGYLRRAITAFKKNCKYDIAKSIDSTNRILTINAADEDVDEIVEILSEGMVVQWLKPYVYQQENLQNVLNSRDWSAYSPANLLDKVKDVYAKAQRDFIQGIREYSYNHGDLKSLHI